MIEHRRYKGESPIDYDSPFHYPESISHGCDAMDTTGSNYNRIILITIATIASESLIEWHLIRDSCSL